MLQKGQRYGRSKTKNKEKKEVNNNRSKKFHGGVAARIIRWSLAVIAGLTISCAVFAPGRDHDSRKTHIKFTPCQYPMSPPHSTPYMGNPLYLPVPTVVFSR